MRRRWPVLAVLGLALVGTAAWRCHWGATPVCAAPGAPGYILVIRGVNVGPDAAWMTRIARDADEAVQRALRRVGLPFQTTTDTEVANGRVDPRQAAAIILPYNRALSPAEVNLLSAAMDQGAALIAFHVAGDQLESRLGVKTGGYAQLEEGTRAILRPDTVSLVGAPPAMTLAPYFQRSFTLVGEGASIAGWWETPGGGEPQPALALTDSGCFLAFVPRSNDVPALSAVLWAILGRVAPRVVSQTLPRTVKELGPIGRYACLADLMNAWRARPEGAEPEAWDYAKRAEAALWRVSEFMAQGKMEEAETQVKQATDLATRSYWAAYSSPAPEIRGVWGYPWPQDGARSWDAAMARLAKAHFNVVFPYMATAGAAYYPSGVLPRAAQGDCDYLQAAVTAGKANGLEVHPRLIALQCLFTAKSVKSALAAQGRMAVNSQGKTVDWLCPTDPRNQEQLLAVATEIVLRYPVQGLQLDYFRYDDTDTCVCPRCRAEFEKATGVKVDEWPQDLAAGPLRARFLQWRQGVLTDLLRALRAQLKAVRPQVRLSVATFPNWRTTADESGQTPAAWAKEGLVDFLCPMDYTDNLQRFQGYIQDQTAQLAGAVPLAVGIGAFADNCPFGSPQQLADQIQAVRKQGAAGFVVFNYNPRLVTDFLPWIELGLTRREADPTWIRS